MATTFSNWASGEGLPARPANGEYAGEDSSGQDPRPQSVDPADDSVEELREELATARRRLQYFEGFAPWIEEQMAAVVDRAAEVSAEGEREQGRLAQEIERRRADVDRLAAERDRLHEEAQAIVAEANASAERVIEEANARAAHLISDAHRTADAMVNRLRSEAAAIVSRALGDLNALEATNASAEPAAAPVFVVEHELPTAEPPEMHVDRNEDEVPTRGAEASINAAGVEHDEVVPLDEIGEPAGPTTTEEPETQASVADLEAEWHGQAEPEAAADEDGPHWPGDMWRDAAANGTEVPVSEDSAEPTAQQTAPAASPDDTGPFQWLRSALAGRDTSARRPATDDESEGAAGGLPFPIGSSAERGAAPDSNLDEVLVTRLTIRPLFAEHQRDALARTVEGLPGVERVGAGDTRDDSFDLLVTHQLFTSMLGSLLAAAGEHIRLIAQRDDSLEVEITGLDWLQGEGASEVSRRA